MLCACRTIPSDRPEVTLIASATSDVLCHMAQSNAHSHSQQLFQLSDLKQLKDNSCLTNELPRNLKQAFPDTNSTEASRSNGVEGISLKEKNRRAQRRSREKQKAKQSQAENRALQLAQQLQELKAQQAAAQSKNLVLEKTVELHNLQAANRARLDLANANDSSSDKLPAANPNHGPDLAHSLNLCKLSIRSPVDMDAIHRAHKDPLLPTRFTPAQMQNMDWAEFTKIWKEYISRMALSLVEAKGEPSSPAGKRIESILEELVAFYCHFAGSQPRKAGQFKWTKLDEDFDSAAGSASPPPDLWQSIAAACNFDGQQRAQICGLNQFLASNLGRILRDRADISGQLSAAVRPQGLGVGLGLPGSQTAHGHVQALQAAEKLHKNLQQAQECLTQFQVAAKQTLTSLQLALCCVQAFPWMPDILAVFKCVADTRQQI